MSKMQESSSTKASADAAVIASIPNFSPPGYILQKVNSLLHSSEILSAIFYCLVWLIIISSSVPVCLVYLPCSLIYKILRITSKNVKLMSWRNARSDIGDGSGKHATLIVLITGCDTGFGHALALEMLSSKPPPPPSSNPGLYTSASYRIYAGCYSPKFAEVLLGKSKEAECKYGNTILPIEMNITSAESVTSVYKLMRTEIGAGSKVYLHSVVSNAGMGTGGMVDFLNLNDSAGKAGYNSDMNVNFFGMVRTVQSFLPILKDQCCCEKKEERYCDSQVVNVTSVAGLLSNPGMSAYTSSKHAAEAFSTSLRLELQVWGINVLTVNPSFHKTPLTSGISNAFDNSWKALPANLKEEYGAEFYASLKKGGMKASQSAEWEAGNVVNGLIRAIRDRERGQLIIGSDAKYALLLLRHLPVSVQDFLVINFIMDGAIKPKRLMELKH